MLQVYLTNIESLPDPKENPQKMQHLPRERQEKIMCYQYANSRKESLGAGLLLQKVLALHGNSLETIKVSKTGKPESDRCCFNLSHSYPMVACAFSDRPVGCDIEKFAHEPPHIAERFFHAREKELLNRLETTRREQMFFRLWTMKESYVKMTGEGMYLAFDAFEICAHERIQVIRDGRICDCLIKEYEVPGYALSVCAAEAAERYTWLSV